LNGLARKIRVPAVIAAAAIGGGALGMTVFAPTSGSAQTTTTTGSSSNSATAGTDTSNSDPTHEASESAQREADETSGKIQPGAGGHSNTDPAHEAAESPARAAQEATDDANASTSTTGG
jgi:hypothetical protein